MPGPSFSPASAWNAPPPAERKLDLAFIPPQIRSIPSPIAKFLLKALRVDALMPVFNGIPPQVSSGEFCLAGLRNMGIDAAFRPRNDIEVAGRKISGTGGTD